MKISTIIRIIALLSSIAVILLALGCLGIIPELKTEPRLFYMIVAIALFFDSIVYWVEKKGL